MMPVDFNYYLDAWRFCKNAGIPFHLIEKMDSWTWGIQSVVSKPTTPQMPPINLYNLPTPRSYS